MDAKDLVQYLGKRADSPDIVKLLAEFDVSKAPRLPPGDIDVAVTLSSEGLLFVFVPVEPRSSVLKLNEIQLYSKLEKGFTSFGGELPYGLTFDDVRADALKKLGKPSLSRREFRLESWVKPDVALTVKFAKGDAGIQMIHMRPPA